MKLLKSVRVALPMLLILHNADVNAQLTTEVPLNCSVEELEFLMAKSGFMNDQYCYDFNQSDTLGYKLGDGFFPSDSYDYALNFNNGVPLDQYSYARSLVCGEDFSISDEILNLTDPENAKINQLVQGLNTENLRTNGVAARNNHARQLLMFPGVLNELLHVSARDINLFQYDFNQYGHVYNLPRYSYKTEGTNNPTMVVQGYIDGQYNDDKWADLEILNNLCEKEGEDCKVTNGKVKIDLTKNNLKQKLTAAQVSRIGDGLDANHIRSLRAAYERGVDCTGLPNHPTCKMLDRLDAASINVDSLDYDSIPSVCSRVSIAPAKRTEEELVPTMLRNYYYGKKRTTNLADYLTNSSQLDGISKGPDLYKVMQWETTAPLADHKEEGHGNCAQRRGATISVNLNLPDGKGKFLEEKGEFVAPFASPSYYTQKRLQSAATLDVFRRLGERFNSSAPTAPLEKILFHALFNAMTPNTHSIGKISFNKLKEQLDLLGYTPIRGKSPVEAISLVQEKVDYVIDQILPYQCRSIDYSGNQALYSPPDGVFDLYVSMTKKIIFDMMAGLKRTNNEWDDFEMLFRSPLRELASRLPGELYHSLATGFTHRYGEKIEYKDPAKKDEWQTWNSDSANAVSAYDFYFNGQVGPGITLADLRDQDDGKASLYDRYARRYLTPYIELPKMRQAVIDSTAPADQNPIDHTQYQRAVVFSYQGDGKFSLVQGDLEGNEDAIGTKIKGMYYNYLPQRTTATLCSESGQKHIIARKMEGNPNYSVFVYNDASTGSQKITTASTRNVGAEVPVEGVTSFEIIKNENDEYVSNSAIAALLDKYSCEKSDNNVFGKVYPFYSQYLHHSGTTVPSSVFNCFSAREGYVDLYNMKEPLKSVLAENSEDITESTNHQTRGRFRRLNDTYFAFTNLKDVAKLEDDGSWTLRIRYGKKQMEKFKYRGYNRDDTNDSVDGREKIGFLGGGWGSGVILEENPRETLMPRFVKYEEIKDDPAYQDSLQYAVQFKKAYDYAKATESQPRFEYVSRFREKDNWRRIDERSGESASQIFYLDALTKYYQIRAYMKEDFFSGRTEIERPDSDMLLFGETKNPHMVILNNCRGCECAKEIGSFTTALKSGKYINFYDNLQFDDMENVNVSTMTFTAADANACIFTPFVPHTASFTPVETSHITPNAADETEEKMNIHVACNLSKYLLGRLHTLKRVKPELVKSDEDAQRVINHCRGRTQYFPTNLSRLSAPADNSANNFNCRLPGGGVSE